jgi:hypothetical protein
LRTLLIAVLVAGGFTASAQEVDAELDARMHAQLLRVAETGGDGLSDLVLVNALGPICEQAGDEKSEYQIKATAERLLERARGLETDPSVLALHLQIDAEYAADTPERALKLDQLRAASAENGYFALVLLSQPEYLDAPERAAALIHLAAQAPRYRSLMHPVLRSMYARVVKQVQADGMLEMDEFVEMSPEAFAFTLAMIYGPQAHLPAYSRFTKICNEQVFDQLRTDCRSFAKRMAADAENYLDLMIANAVLKRLADNPQEAEAVDARIRELKWLQTQHSQLSSKFGTEAGDGWNPELETWVQPFIRNWVELGELAASRQMLRDAGISEQPPADWSPDTERAVK